MFYTYRHMERTKQKGDALLQLTQLKHIRKGAIVHLGSVMRRVARTYAPLLPTAKPNSKETTCFTNMRQ